MNPKELIETGFAVDPHKATDIAAGELYRRGFITHEMLIGILDGKNRPEAGPLGKESTQVGFHRG